MAHPQLRDYQTDIYNRVIAAWEANHRAVMAVLPTGAGKTVTFSHAIHEHQGMCCAIAHRQELVSQMSIALARYEVKHRVLSPENVVRSIIQQHIVELKRDYVDPSARCAVAGVDTVVSWAKPEHKQHYLFKRWAAQVTLVIMDEGHHTLTANKWGKVLALFPNARVLLVTATPERADGKGLGRHADGIVDVMQEGPGMRELISRGFLTDYRVFCPPSDLDLSAVAVGADGDLIRAQLAKATRKSTVMGHVVEHYQRIAPGKLGVTFAPDVETAVEFAVLFNQAGVPAEVVSAKTPDNLRREIINRFKRRELLQLVNVDLFGEGFDLPAIEVVTMARATQSYALYCLDPETEVLTPDGWKRHDRVGAWVTGYDSTTGQTQTVPVTGRVKRALYDGEQMYRMDGPHLDFMVSDKHDLLVMGLSHTCKTWQKQHAENVSQRKAMYRVPVAGEGQFAGSGLTADELWFLGWYLSDGSINRKTNSLCISQSVGKDRHIESIRAALKGCGFKFSEGVYKRKNVPDTHRNAHRFLVSKGEPRGCDKHLTGWARLEKWLDKSVPACYDQLTRDELLTLLETLNLGDGVNEHRSLDYVKNTLTIACGTNHRMADRLQALCVTRGLRCNLSPVQYEDRSEWFYLHIRDTKTATMAGQNVPDGTISGKKEYKRSRLEPTADRPDFVWCVTNPLGTLVTRRNGKVIIMGNCQQFGRALRPMDGKSHAIIIDHVGNVLRHGLPDRPRVWTLDRRERSAKRAVDPEVIPMRVCCNPVCMAPFEKHLDACPFCGWVPVPAGRSKPEQVDGCLYELEPEVLAAMRGEVAKVDQHPDAVRAWMRQAGHDSMVANSAAKRQREKQDQQAVLRESMAWYGGVADAAGLSHRETQRKFYLQFGVDVLSAMALGRADAEVLTTRINQTIGRTMEVTQ